jgi:hypothetical protein
VMPLLVQRSTPPDAAALTLPNASTDTLAAADDGQHTTQQPQFQVRQFAAAKAMILL